MRRIPSNAAVIVIAGLILAGGIGHLFQASAQDSGGGGSFIMGADVSTLQRSEDLGAKYYDDNGIQGDPLQILKEHGVNFIRLRVWVNPANGYNNKDAVVRFARKVKALGLKLLIDFHYSDTWADPGHQQKPAAWAGDSFSKLQDDVYAYTFDVCSSLMKAGATPDMVQIGNEINAGMLWPDGSTNNWPQLAALLKKGYEAAKACSLGIQVMLHIANAGDKGGAELWLDNAKELGVKWDVTGLSYYSYWHGTMEAMTNTLAALKTRYGKPLIIAETAYPFTLENADNEKNVIYFRGQLTPGYPATPKGQADNLRNVIAAAKAGGASGIFYWEPTWIATPGNGWDPANSSSGDGWENQALFDFNGKALPALNDFR